MAILEFGIVFISLPVFFQAADIEKIVGRWKEIAVEGAALAKEGGENIETEVGGTGGGI